MHPKSLLLALSLALVTSSFSEVSFAAEVSTALENITLEGPWEKIIKDRNKETEYDGVMRLSQAQGGRLVSIKISVRGTTSIDPKECSFPKLKIKVANKTDADIFDGSNSIKIGTHCGDEKSASEAGRIRNGGAGTRGEHLAYQILTALNVPHQSTQWAQITYVDPTSTKFQPRTRPAFFLETEKAMSKRMGAEVIDYTQDPHDREGLQFDNITSDKVNGKSAALVYLSEMLLGNNDFGLPLSDEVLDPDEMMFGIKNVVILNSGNQRIAAPQDFDLAATITGDFPPLCMEEDCSKMAETEQEHIQAFVRSRFSYVSTYLTEVEPQFKADFQAALSEFSANLHRVTTLIDQAATKGDLPEAQARRFKLFTSEVAKLIKTPLK
ncbi:hypothetical protein [Bdellovibrio sp. HCB337]|uniref:hypothetical protein n=1 Tax=Bdellovibrio sp. HCB337 TaxID=3394358 RepID=UPI0039A74D33